MSRTPEGEQKDLVKKYLKSIGAYQFWPVPSGYGRQGIDCYACIAKTWKPARFWAIEVKASEAEQPTARQKQTLNEVHAAGGIIISGTADQIIKHIEYVFRLDS